MNVIFTKEKRTNVKSIAHKTSPREPLDFSLSSSNQSGLHASGDGDCARCCRLCGGDSCLKYFRDTYVWEGVEERYDQLLYDCFGVTVTASDCMICDWCIRALRGTERFKALVHAAFGVTASASDMASSNDESSTVITIKPNNCDEVASNELAKPKEKKQTQLKKNIVALTKRQEAKKVWTTQEKEHKVIVQCEFCKQRYPMMVGNGGCKTFTCSRCKKNKDRSSLCKKCNVVMPGNMLKAHTELHVKADVRGRNRLRQSKKPLSPSRTNVAMANKLMFQCTKCPKRYSLVNDLAVHMKNVHEDSGKLVGSCACQHQKCEPNPEGSLLSPRQCPECHCLLKNEKL